jgi:MoaA/NifB/PqqE/SkfB family radical SAM enzyme
MVDPIQEMPFLRNIGLLVTYKCQVACPHCIVEAGPHRTEYMQYDETCDWINQIASYRNKYIKVVSFTGGEPFFDVEFLKKTSEFAGNLGLFVSAVTNAYWALSLQKAINVLRSLPAIKMIQISTDVYHQQSIPIERVGYAIKAAEISKTPYTIAVCTEKNSDPGYLHILEQLKNMTDPESIYTSITFRAGRALKRGAECGYEMSDDPPESACGAGSAPIILPDGKVVACIGPIVNLRSAHPLWLGNLREEPLTEILDRAELNPILHAIRLWGPKRIIHILEGAGYRSELPSKYIKNSVCQACFELMANSSIVNYLEELEQDPAFNRKVAYGRAYYLQEPDMVLGLGLNA